MLVDGNSIIWVSSNLNYLAFLISLCIYHCKTMSAHMREYTWFMIPKRVALASIVIIKYHFHQKKWSTTIHIMSLVLLNRLITIRLKHSTNPIS